MKKKKKKKKKKRETKNGEKRKAKEKLHMLLVQFNQWKKAKTGENFLAQNLLIAKNLIS